MPQVMPPLNALRAFEAAARLGSMSKAAEELNVTPGALSHQVRGLEDFLQVKLFERLARSIELTDAGEVLYPGLATGFQQLKGAVTALRPAADPNVLVASTPPGLTAKWLAPRLYKFAGAHPDIEVRVASSFKSADFVTDGVDVAIRNLAIGQPAPEGLVVDFMGEIRLLPVCAPGFAASHGPFDAPADLAKAPLIQDDTFSAQARYPKWADWFDAAGAPEANHGGVLTFNSPDHALDAAAQGGGVLLAHNILAHDDLASGRLIAPYDLDLPTGRAFYLVYPETARDAPAVAAFREWVLAEISEMPDWRQADSCAASSAIEVVLAVPDGARKG